MLTSIDLKAMALQMYTVIQLRSSERALNRDHSNNVRRHSIHYIYNPRRQTMEVEKLKRRSSVKGINRFLVNRRWKLETNKVADIKNRENRHKESQNSHRRSLNTGLRQSSSDLNCVQVKCSLKLSTTSHRLNYLKPKMQPYERVRGRSRDHT